MIFGILLQRGANVAASLRLKNIFNIFDFKSWLNP